MTSIIPQFEQMHWMSELPTHARKAMMQHPYREVSLDRVAEIKDFASAGFENCSLADVQQMVLDMIVAWDKLDQEAENAFCEANER